MEGDSMRDNHYTWLHDVAPLPKLLMMVLTLVAATAVKTIAFLAGLICFEVFLVLWVMPSKQAKNILAGMAVCGLFVGAVQYFYLSFPEVLLIVLRMFAMALIFPPLLATMRMRDLRDTLVHRLRVPGDYAFMFTTALRYVPDLLADAKYIMDAQSCRGCDFEHGTPWQRIGRYMAVLAPLVMHGLNRAETLAMSMELRGYGSIHNNQMVPALQKSDVLVIVVLCIGFSVFVVLGR
jgi:energy-coupling factor transport system permease protein